MSMKLSKDQEMKNQLMKAKCPHCFGTGCDFCDRGSVSISFATGNVFTRYCGSCKFANGGYTTKLSKPPEESGDCVMCGDMTSWKLMGKIEDDEQTDIPPNAGGDSQKNG